MLIFIMFYAIIYKKEKHKSKNKKPLRYNLYDNQKRKK